MQSNEYHWLRSELNKDVTHFASQLDDDSNIDVIRRSYIRSVFAFIEGHVYAFKQLALKISKEKDGIALTAKEVDALKEIKTTEKPNGQIKTSRKLSTAKKRLQLSFIALAKQHEADFTLNEGNGWDCYCASIKIRDRLMHPKSYDDLKVKEKEIGDSQRAYSWFSGELERLAQAIGEKNRA